GIFDCVKQTVKGHGVFGLYRGLSILIYGSIPKSAFRFVLYVKFIHDQALEKPRFRGFIHGLSCIIKDEGIGVNKGLFGRVLNSLLPGLSEAVFAVTPMETIKVKFIHDQALEKPRFRGFIHGLSCIIKDEGIGGIYKGVTATMLKQGSNQAMRFFVMETLKDWYRGGDNSVAIPKPIVGLFGACAGLVSVYGKFGKYLFQIINVNTNIQKSLDTSKLAKMVRTVAMLTI
ncbi:unnamed protein product, partial [Cylicostephanus goldi]